MVFVVGLIFVSVVFILFFFFFFSSRRRHTRWTGDWSSDVCSSDLDFYGPPYFDDMMLTTHKDELRRHGFFISERGYLIEADDLARKRWQMRSEERRVGKECRARWSQDE